MDITSMDLGPTLIFPSYLSFSPALAAIRLIILVPTFSCNDFSASQRYQ